VNQTAGHVKAEAQKPQNQQHYENCPKHVDLLCSFEGAENRVSPKALLSCRRSERLPALQARSLGPRRN
jgi:hypothetical protein